MIESAKTNREIETQWAIIAQKNIPQELYQEIAQQYESASQLLASKDAIIKQLQTELKVKVGQCTASLVAPVSTFTNNCYVIGER